MKTFFQILFVLCFPLVGMAQGNLQFNQTKFIERISYPSNNSVVDSFNIVVPTGKTLKIESILLGAKGCNSTICSVSSLYSCDISINDGVVYNTYNSVTYKNFPIWLPTGTYLVRVVAGNIYSTSVKTNISAIEFNIIP